jgi:hypothetical protein
VRAGKAKPSPQKEKPLGHQGERRKILLDVISVVGNDTRAGFSLASVISLQIYNAIFLKLRAYHGTARASAQANGHWSADMNNGAVD